MGLAPPVYASVPRCWPGETVVCVGTGPSLTAEAVASVRGRARVIAIKDAIDLAPWADCLYACGSDRNQWWQRRGDAVNFQGPRYTLDAKAAKWADVLKFTGVDGLETRPEALRTGQNSGYQAINLARHFGARTIVLLGYDMRARDNADHYFGNHAHGTRLPFPMFIRHFKTLVEPLRAEGITVLNATPDSAITDFPRVTLDAALAEAMAA